MTIYKKNLGKICFCPYIHQHLFLSFFTSVIIKTDVKIPQFFSVPMPSPETSTTTNNSHFSNIEFQDPSTTTQPQIRSLSLRSALSLSHAHAHTPNLWFFQIWECWWFALVVLLSVIGVRQQLYRTSPHAPLAPRT